MEVFEMSRGSIIGCVILSTAFWLGVFEVSCRVQPHRNSRWNGHSAGLIHGVIMSVLTGFFTLCVNPSPISDPGGKSNVYEVFITILCLGYFIFDTIWCVWRFNVYGQETSVIAVHHFVAMFGLVASLSYGCSGTEVCCIVFLAEIANPMYHMRWFLRELGVQRRNKWYELNDLIFLVTFIGARFFLTPFLVYFMVIHARTLNIFKTFGVSYCVMNFIQAAQVLQFAFKKYVNMLWEWAYGQALFIPPLDKRSDVLMKNGGKAGNVCRLRNGQQTFDLSYGE